MQACILFDEFRGKAIKEAEEIMGDEYLSIAAQAGPDSDGRDVELLRYPLRQSSRHRFEHQAKNPRFFQGKCVINQLFGCRTGPRLRAEAAKDIHALRGEAQVSHDRDAGGHNLAHGFGPVVAAFQFYGIHASLLKKAAGGRHGLLKRNLVGHEGHIADEHGLACSTKNRPRMMEHILHGYGKSIWIREYDHAERVADQDGVDAGAIDRQGCRIVIGGKHSNWLTVLFLIAEITDGKFGALDFPWPDLGIKSLSGQRHLRSCSSFSGLHSA